MYLHSGWLSDSFKGSRAKCSKIWSTSHCRMPFQLPSSTPSESKQMWTCKLRDKKLCLISTSVVSTSWLLTPKIQIIPGWLSTYFRIHIRRELNTFKTFHATSFDGWLLNTSSLSNSANSIKALFSKIWPTHGRSSLPFQLLTSKLQITSNEESCPVASTSSLSS